MKTAASVMWVGTTFLCAAVHVSCGGDDSSTGGSAGAGGSATTATTAGSGGGSTGAGTGGSTTGSGGSGGSGMSDCPANPPVATSPCNLDHSCTYGASSCDCVDMQWTCTGGGTDAGSGMCPTDPPGPGDMCTMEGQKCIYDSGHTECTCSTADGWGCTAHR